MSKRRVRRVVALLGALAALWLAAGATLVQFL